jgi:hypothetical protein
MSLAAAAFACNNGGRVQPIADGGSEATCPAGPSQCGASSPCPQSDYCREEVAECPGYQVSSPPNVVTLTTSCCRPLGAPCQGNIDCAPTETCSNGTCELFPDQCGLVEPRCPSLCHWDRSVCACVCLTCPDAGGG